MNIVDNVIMLWKISGSYEARSLRRLEAKAVRARETNRRHKLRRIRMLLSKAAGAYEQLFARKIRSRRFSTNNQKHDNLERKSLNFKAFRDARGSLFISRIVSTTNSSRVSVNATCIGVIVRSSYKNSLNFET